MTFMLKGTAACPGCPIPRELDMILSITGSKSVVVVPASCSTIVMGDDVHGQPAVVPVVHTAFAASASVASGIEEALESQGKEANVIVWAGDGSTGDIGFSAVSGAAERNENIMYVCYDNEAYMNTGIQRSGLTPRGAWSTTTPEGKREAKKLLPFMMMDHKVPYVATLSMAYAFDFQSKVKKAASIKGFKYLHLLSPCPPGWKFDASLTVTMAKLAVDTGIWPLMEYEQGKLRLTGPSNLYVNKAKRRPLDDYLSLQGRFKSITKEEKSELEQDIDALWNEIQERIALGKSMQ
ncbi:MAG: 3-methyl-2-oxobutanoate dehydrogenase subunit beta [Candidatus Micrarchaeia archaeon]